MNNPPNQSMGSHLKARGINARPSPRSSHTLKAEEEIKGGGGMGGEDKTTRAELPWAATQTIDLSRGRAVHGRNLKDTFLSAKKCVRVLRTLRVNPAACFRKERPLLP